MPVSQPLSTPQSAHRLSLRLSLDAVVAAYIHEISVRHRSREQEPSSPADDAPAV